MKVLNVEVAIKEAVTTYDGREMHLREVEA
jgi:hypothetical protein